MPYLIPFKKSQFSKRFILLAFFVGAILLQVWGLFTYEIMPEVECNVAWRFYALPFLIVPFIVHFFKWRRESEFLNFYFSLMIFLLTLAHNAILVVNNFSLEAVCLNVIMSTIGLCLIPNTKVLETYVLFFSALPIVENFYFSPGDQLFYYRSGLLLAATLLTGGLLRRLTIIEIDRQQLEIKKRDNQIADSNKWVQIGQLAGCIAHEINNPLGIIQLTVDSVEHKIDKGQFDAIRTKEELQKINRSLLRISKITKSLKRLGHSHAENIFTKVNLKEVLEELNTIIYPRIKNSKIELQCAHEGLDEFYLDESDLLQLVLIFIENAIYACEETQRTSLIKVHLLNERSGLRILISDTGRGIPEPHRKKIFNEIFTTKEIGKGTGLGLNIAKKICEQLAGSIKVASYKDPTTFEIFLPVLAEPKLKKAA